MTLPENTPKPEEPSQGGENFLPEEPGLPEGFTPLGEPIALPPARHRRRTRRYFVTPNADERSALVENLARRAFPSFEFFLFALLGGAILGAGFILDSQALLLLGILLAPLMTPWVGVVLGAMTGSWRFFFQTLIALLAAGLLILLTGGLAGLAARIWLPLPLFQANIHAHLWWPNFIVLALGAVLMVYSFVRSQDRPVLPSVMLSYGLFLPLSAAGFGLGSGAAHLWPDGALVCLVHLALVTLLGGIVLAALRFKPSGFFGSVLPVLVGLLCLAALVVLTGLGNLALGVAGGSALHKPTPSPTAIRLPSVTPSFEKTATPLGLSPTPTVLSSATVTWTPSPQPTPSYAVINSAVGGGALVRSDPGSGTVLATLLNGILVQVLPEIQSVGGSDWVRVRTSNGIEGWVLQIVLMAATPSPTLTPAVSPTR